MATDHRTGAPNSDSARCGRTHPVGPNRSSALLSHVVVPEIYFENGFRTVARMNLRNEPTPDPSQEGNGSRTRAGLLPSLEGLGVGLRLGAIRKCNSRIALVLRSWACGTLWVRFLFVFRIFQNQNRAPIPAVNPPRIDGVKSMIGATSRKMSTGALSKMYDTPTGTRMPTWSSP